MNNRRIFPLVDEQATSQPSKRPDSRSNSLTTLDSPGQFDILINTEYELFELDEDGTSQRKLKQNLSEPTTQRSSITDMDTEPVLRHSGSAPATFTTLEREVLHIKFMQSESIEQQNEQKKLMGELLELSRELKTVVGENIEINSELKEITEESKREESRRGKIQIGVWVLNFIYALVMAIIIWEYPHLLPVRK